MSTTHHQKGTKVTPTEHTTKTPHTATRIFVALRGLLHTRGSGASNFSPRGAILSVVVTTLGVLAFASAPALAAGPEAPVTSSPAKSVTATTAILEGTLNPGASATAGWYFAYGTEIVCAAGATTAVQPEVTGKAVKEHTEVTGLEPNKKYTFCIVATNAAEEATPSANEVTFETKALAPSVPSVSASDVKATEARLEGIVNPNNEPTTECKFEYGTTTGYGTELPCEPATLEGYGEQSVGATATGLAQKTNYDYRVVVKNATGTSERAGSLKTYLTPETPETKPANPVAGTTATLHGVVNPKAAGEVGGKYEFRYRQSTSECQGQSATPAGTATGKTPEPVEAEIEGLAPGTIYAFCLVAENSAGEEAVVEPTETFRTLATAPVVSVGKASSGAASTATVSAEITPDGAPTGYHAEYVTEAQFQASGWAEATSVPASDAELPATDTPISVSEHLSDLVLGTVYRFRFVATNEAAPAGGVPGEEATFTTVSTGAAASTLPDQRAYELVTGLEGEPYLPPTPVETGAQARGFRTALLFRAAAKGEAIAYVGEPAATTGTGEIAPGEGNQWLAKRTSGGWRTEDITPNPNNAAMYESFSSELSTGIYEGDATPLEGTGVEKNCSALYSRASENRGFQALFTSGETPEACGSPLFAGATEDESQIILQSEAALVAPAVPATEADRPPGHGEPQAPGFAGSGCMYGCNLYDWSAGRLRLVNEVEGSPVPSATFGGYPLGEHELTNFSNAISGNGSDIFWTDTQAEKNGAPNPDFEHVFVQENGTTEVQVSGAGPAEYWTATPDGHYAYYTEDGALWRFNTEAGVVEPHEELTSSAAQVQGVIGTNQTGPDGAYLYFVAAGSLDGAPARVCVSYAAQLEKFKKELSEELITEAKKEADEHKLANEESEEERGETPPDTGCNLYLLHEGQATFVTTLSPADNEIVAESGAATPKAERSSDWRANVGERIAGLTPDGQQLIFQSGRELTGYDSRVEGKNAGEVHHEVEVYLYSAGEGKLACPSCSPSGTPPTVAEVHPPESKLPVSANAQAYTRRWISENGSRVFFDSSEALVPQDKNEVQDVYEWERVASPSEPDNPCTAEMASAVTGGCTFLLSGGTSKQDSFLVDADTTGDNVFFEHVGPLGQVEAPSDHNELYDARVNGGFPQTTLACTGTGCQGVPPAPPTFATPASATFSGEGNPPTPTPAKAVVKSLTRAQKLAKALAGCRKERAKRRRVKCEKSAHAKYGAKKTKKTKKTGAERRTH